MPINLSTNIEAKIRESVQMWITNGRDFLAAEGIATDTVLYVVWGEKHGFASFLLSAFIKRVYVIVTANDLYVVRAKWLNCWRKIDSKRYNLKDLVGVQIRPGFMSETVEMSFRDSTAVKMTNVEKGLGEPLQRVAQEGIHVIAKS